MIGDVCLALKNWFKEQTCVHDYGAFKEPPCQVEGYSSYQECKKCGRLHWS